MNPADIIYKSFNYSPSHFKQMLPAVTPPDVPVHPPSHPHCVNNRYVRLVSFEEDLVGLDEKKILNLVTTLAGLKFGRIF